MLVLYDSATSYRMLTNHYTESTSQSIEQTISFPNPLSGLRKINRSETPAHEMCLKRKPFHLYTTFQPSQLSSRYVTSSNLVPPGESLQCLRCPALERGMKIMLLVVSTFPETSKHANDMLQEEKCKWINEYEIWNSDWWLFLRENNPFNNADLF